MADTNRTSKIGFSIGLLAVIVICPVLVGPGAQAQHSSFRDFLPIPPNDKKVASPYLGEELAEVPEVSFQDSRAGRHDQDEVASIAGTINKINHLNKKKADGFMELLLLARSDLRGLPFTLGDACRMKPERGKQFRLALANIRDSISSPSVHFYPTASAKFWEKFWEVCQKEDEKNASSSYSFREQVTLARIAALMQVFGLEWGQGHMGLVKYLAGVSHKEASRALTRIALFATANDVRQAAAATLKNRHSTDYADILYEGMRYPWPPVARRAAQTMSKLKRAGFVPELVAFLDEPDPRLPVLKDMFGEKVPVVRELVRINHHRNCLLCHGPGTGKLSEDVVRAPMPIPSRPFSPFAGYYNSDPSQTVPDILVRADVTYLRQDFSVLMAVPDFSHPWPMWQRFDFVVRNRVLTQPQAEEFRQRYEKNIERSPYQSAALQALRELTGRDAEPTANAWRKTLDRDSGSR